MPATRPLAGVTVLAVEQYGAGPFGSMLLADLGAEVLKIENPKGDGDVGRHVGPHFFAPGDSHFFHAFNRNKRSVALDLKHPAGMAAFRELVRGADAVLDNLRGDQAESLGVTYNALKDANPAIVCAHLSAYGREGSRKAWPGYDYLMQAEAGYLAVTGEPDGPPTRFGLSVVDMMTGLMAGFALVSGLVGARATGRGMDLDVSLFETALHNLTYLAAWHGNAGHAQGREPRGAHPSLVPSQLFRTADGWIFIMCNKEKFWPPLTERLGHPEWAADARYASFAARLRHRAEITELMEQAFMARGTAEWLGILQGAVPAAPVFDVAEALENPFVAERGAVADFTRREGGAPVRMLRGPVRVDGAAPPTMAAPALGEATEEMLRRAGLDAEHIAALRAAGAAR